MIKISNRALSAPSSPVRKLVPLAEKAKENGIKIYHINIGDPDFETPQPIIKKLKETANNLKRLPYTSSKGLKSTILAFKKYYKDIKIDLNIDDILITSGGGEALGIVASIVLDPKDQLLVLEPFYANYACFTNQVSGKIVPVSLSAKNGFHLPKKEEIVKKITPKTKAIFFTNPNNPTGTVFTKEEVRTMIDIACENNLFLVSDETYMGMCFDNIKTVSVLRVATEKEKQNIIVVDSISKKLNACGARIGVIISKNKDVMDAAFRFAQGRLSVAYIEQEMIFPMLSNCLDYVAWLTKQYQKRRDTFVAALEKELNIKLPKPEGAFYSMVPLPIKDTDDFAKWLLTDFRDNGETVMVAPGAGFYATPGKGKNEVRVAYVLNEKDLARAAELLALGIKKYNLSHQ